MENSLKKKKTDHIQRDANSENEKDKKTKLIRRVKMYHYLSYRFYHTELGLDF